MRLSYYTRTLPDLPWHEMTGA